MNFVVSASTDVGNVKKTNQDSLKVMSISTSIGKVVFAILCDGMGGLSKGELASANVIHAFSIWAKEFLPKILEQGITEDKIKTDWTEIIQNCNEKIKDYGSKLGSAVGTTLTTMLLTPTRYYIANVGDTRAYEIFDKTVPLTVDQTVVGREVAMGIITKEQAKTDPRRSVLLQCIGASGVVYPEMFYGDVKKDAVYMLCSDGFRHEITREEIFEYFKPEKMLSNQMMKDAELALIDINKQRRERDNISVITIRTY